MRFHITNLNCGPICIMSITLFPSRDSLLFIVSIGFSFTVFMEIGSLNVSHVFVVSTCPVYFEVFEILFSRILCLFHCDDL
jgi:hypothetical protein